MQIQPFANQVYEKISLYNSFLINVHPHPDLDTIGSAIGLKKVLEILGKKVDIVCPDTIDKVFDVLQAREHIRTVDFKELDFSIYDAFFIVDTRDLVRMSLHKYFTLPDIPVFVIDHHDNNNIPSPDRLVVPEAPSSSYLLYHLFQEWQVELTEPIATCLLAGILIDTEFMKYTRQPVETAQVVADLLKKGARMQTLVEDYFSIQDASFLRFLGTCLHGIIIEGHCMWSIIPYAQFSEFSSLSNARETIANMFFRNIKGIDLGILLIEEQPGHIQASFRSSSKVDAAKLAQQFGGGGHIDRSGAAISGNLEETSAAVIAAGKAASA